MKQEMDVQSRKSKSRFFFALVLAAARGLYSLGFAGAARAVTGPPAPAVAAAGCRYLAITPQPWGSDVALQLTGLTCFGVEDSPDVGCVSLYVQANGRLGATPFYRSVANWGTVFVFGPEIVPSAPYTARAVDAQVGAGPANQVALTRKWGDTNGDDTVNQADIDCAVSAFQGVYAATCTKQSADVFGTIGGASQCTPNGLVNFMDISKVVDAVNHAPFPCSGPCNAVQPVEISSRTIRQNK